jgi:subtilisin family serine protease
MITQQGGEVRSVDRLAGIIVAKVSGQFASQFEATNKALGTSSYVSQMAISKEFTTNWEQVSTNPMTGQDTSATQVVIRPTANNHQLPTEEMNVSALKSYIFEKYHFTPNGDSVKLAILDTGVDIAHRQVFQDRIISSWDVTRDGNINLEEAPVSEDGTHIAIPMSQTTKPISIALNTPELKEASEYYVGSLHEASYANATGIVDINQDSKMDSSFRILMIRSPLGYRVAIDTNNNLDFADEKFVANYEEGQETIIMDVAKQGIVRMNVNIYLNSDGSLKKSSNGKVQINVAGFDNDRHGTHVAGIAAGNFQAAQFSSHFYGAAPAAKIIAIKILSANTGSNSDVISGMILAAEKGADVINMSINAASLQTDGQDIVSSTVDRMIRTHKMIFVVAAGNDGPGVLSVGLPAASHLAISVGAAVTGATLTEAYNEKNVAEGHYLWRFSSVGPSSINHGKPTLVAPGSALSSVPLGRNLWRPDDDAVYDVYQGTSMAAPATAGVVTLLIDAATKINQQQKTTLLPKDSKSIEMALIDSAVSLNTLNMGNQNLPHYFRIEEGAGHIDALGAFQHLEKRSPETTPNYKIQTKSWNTAYDQSAVGIFTTRVLPRTLKFELSKEADEANDVDFYRVLTLSSTVDWIQVPQNEVALTAANISEFHLEVDQEKMKAFPSGIHEAQLVLRNQDNGQLEHIVNVTYLKPKELTSLGDQSRFLEPQVRIPKGGVQRYYFYIPQGRTGLTMDLETQRYLDSGDLSGPGYRLTVVNPKGQVIYRSKSEIGGLDNRIGFTQRNPMPGTYEVSIFRSHNHQASSQLSLSVSTSAIASDSLQWQPIITAWPSQLTTNIDLTNYGEELDPRLDVDLDSILLEQTGVPLVKAHKSEVSLIVPRGVSQVSVETFEVDGARDDDIDLSLVDEQGRSLGQSLGPASRESISAEVVPGQKLILRLTAYHLAQERGTITVFWSFALNKKILGTAVLNHSTMEWMRTNTLSLSLNLDPRHYQDLLLDIKTWAQQISWTGSAKVFDESKGYSIPVYEFPIKALMESSASD